MNKKYQVFAAECWVSIRQMKQSDVSPGPSACEVEAK